MNLELLQKLVKLANNNPNENEANAAARKVCLMISESEFKFKEDFDPYRRAQNVYPTAQPTYNQDFQDLINQLFGQKK